MKNKAVLLYRFVEESKQLVFHTAYKNLAKEYIQYEFGGDSLYSGKWHLKNNKPAENRYKIANISGYPTATILQKNSQFYIRNIPSTGNQLLPVICPDIPQTIVHDRFYNSYYLGGSTGMQRFFPHITQYPLVYNGTNTNATHSIMQTADGHLFAGSYNGILSQLTDNGAKVTFNKNRILPGGL